MHRQIGDNIKMKNKQIKLIASDMDGTLLNTEGVLNPDFFSVYQQLKKEGITFVAASGRQYYNLIKLFDSIKDEIIFIAENGTYVVYREQVLLVVDLSEKDVRKIIPQVRGIKGLYPVLCGKKKAYIEDDFPEFVKHVIPYYERCEYVSDLMDVSDDEFLKIAIYDFEGSAKNGYPLLQHFNESFKVVVSGSNWLDISRPEANKGNALKLIQDYLSITKEECMAFGDQMNDAEMLQNVSFSYAMENASGDLKRYARFLAPSNDSNGVLTVLKDTFLN